MSSDEEMQPASIAAELERRDWNAGRRETVIMAGLVAIAAIAVASLILWDFGWPLIGPVWVAMAGLLAVANFYSQRSIRLLRRHAMEMRQRADRACELLELLRR